MILYSGHVRCYTWRHGAIHMARNIVGEYSTWLSLHRVTPAPKVYTQLSIFNPYVQASTRGGTLSITPSRLRVVSRDCASHSTDRGQQTPAIITTTAQSSRSLTVTSSTRYSCVSSFSRISHSHSTERSTAGAIITAENRKITATAPTSAKQKKNAFYLCHFLYKKKKARKD